MNHFRISPNSFEPSCIRSLNNFPYPGSVLRDTALAELPKKNSPRDHVTYSFIMLKVSLNGGHITQA